MQRTAATRGGPAVKGSPALKTETSVIHPILACLKKAEDELGPGRVWNPTNDLQSQFLREFFPNMGDVTKFSEEELKSILSTQASAINAFLRENGFQIELKEFGPMEFGVASVLNVLVEWLSLGKLGQLDLTGRGVYPSVQLKGDQGVDVLDAGSSYPHPVVSIATKTGDQLLMTIASEQYNGFDLTGRVQTLRKVVSSCRSQGQFDGAIFPMVHYDREVDIEWILGMNTTDSGGVGTWISQAKQQTRFRMNERGARAESAVAMGMTRMCAPVMRKPYIIDRPFILWIERPGVDLPIFSGLFAEDVWENPGSLD